MKFWITISLAFTICSVQGQSDSAWVKTIQGLDGPGDQIAACVLDSGLLILQADKSSYLLTDLPSPKGKAFSIKRAQLSTSEESAQVFDLAFIREGNNDDGTVFLHEQSSTYWFSSANNYGDAQGRKLKLYSASVSEGKISAPKPFIHNSPRFNICHPWLNDDGNRIFFATDRSGGAGGMDIWYCSMLVDGWSLPIWAGEAVNTKGNEVFPTMQGANLYFSSDGQEGANGLDLYRTNEESQWKSVAPLPAPVNSPGDDFQLIFASDAKGFFTSNRKGELTGDDIYRFELYADEGNQHSFTAQLMCKGTELQGELIKVFNEDGELLLKEETSADGAFNVSFLEPGGVYTVIAENLSPIIAPHAFLHVKDSEGALVQLIPIGADNSFRFEMLPNDNSALQLMDNLDESILAIELEGQIYDNKPGDIGRGQPVYISSQEGELLALVYTSATGRFEVDDLRPLKEYVVQVDNTSRAQNIILERDGEHVLIPFSDFSAEFDRLNEESSIEILDEFNRPIQIAESDVFIVKSIYYKFNSADLNDVAKSQLAHLATIMRNNPGMGIELSSHTDSRGEAEYNALLSERRAGTAVDYLVEQGIAIERLTPKGYGESQLINQCDDNAKCNESEHALNRRTELRILFE